MKNSTLYKRLYAAGLIKFIKYGLVGVLGLVVDMGVFYLLNKKLGVNYVVANIISSSLAIIHNFILNSYFTFKITDNKLKRFATFYLIALIGMAVSSGLLVVFIDGLKLDTMVSKLITVFIVAIGQFIFNKKLTFRKNKK